MKPTIKIKSLDVQSISNSSGIFYGNNKLHHFRGTSTKNEGFGDVKGDRNSIRDNQNTIVKHRKN